MAAIPIILQVVIAFFGAYMIALWFSMIVWTYYDIRARSQDLYVHIFATALVVVFNVFGLVLYLILRPRETLAEAYERSLEEETLLQEIEERPNCPSCRQRIQADFVLCPYCHTELKQRCPRCERLLLPKWDICPYCGNTQVPNARRIEPHLPRTSLAPAPATTTTTTTVIPARQ
ncbi:MAG: zinc ribbon domain-containing protein [Chloroflexi bacterium]|nr:zinc ribbon domain-containing protein [Chloroflexota bacterium]